jgi:hypothetical protein|nr:MAG TPA: hypothetical protein [Caudoviricetes sp.]
MARAIDGDALKRWCEKIIDHRKYITTQTLSIWPTQNGGEWREKRYRR